jgi:predicted nuclease with TOPRIM domain
LFFCQEQEATLDGEQVQHLERDRERLAQRVEELEGHCSTLLEDKARLVQEVAALSNNAQQLTFHNNTLQAQAQLVQAGGDTMQRFTADYR